MNRLISVLIILLLVTAACGEKKQEDKDAQETFRIPDSLLSPLDGYRLW